MFQPRRSFLIPLLLSLAAPQALAQQIMPQEFPLQINELPKDQWNKNRLVPERIEGGLRLVDKDSAPFNDASFWQVSFNEALPYGRKEFSFSLEVDPEHKPLWGNSLMQPILNGKEAVPALDETGNPAFEKIIADDGKGFISVQSGTIRLALSRSEKMLGTFSFMTAGAQGYNIAMKDFKVTVWPENDDRVWPQRPHVSALGYTPDEDKILFVEWNDDDESRAVQSTKLTLTGPDLSEEIQVALPLHPSAASASRVSQVDLSKYRTPGKYIIDVPSFGTRTEAASTSFEILKTSDHLTQLRDEAWGVFYWITDNEDGPFPKAHTQDAAAKVFGTNGETRDVRGGWFDAGDYGKYSVNGAYSVSLVLLTGLLAPDALAHSISPIAGGEDSRPDWLDVADAQLDWLYKMQRADGGVNHKATTRDWPNLDTRPTDDRAVKWLMPVSSTATAGFAAAMSLAARAYAASPVKADKAKSARFQKAAERALGWLEANPNLTMIEDRYDGAEYGGPYTDTDDSDERFFAAAAYATLTRDATAIPLVADLLDQRRAALSQSNNDTYWGGVDLLGFWALKSGESILSPEEKSKVDAALASAAHKWRIKKVKSSWGIAMGDNDPFPWGSNSVIATVGWHWLLWSFVSGDEKYVSPAQDQLHWYFGRNPLGQTYITGSGKKAAKNPHFRPSVSGAIKLPNGLLVGGPNSVNLAGDPTAGGLSGQPPMRMYVDDKESYATNEVAINWQSAWAVYTSLLVHMQ